MRAGSPGEFQFRSHDNFKISERASLWNWKSRDIGGRSALDYLIRVEGRSFVEAVFIPSEEAFLIRTQRRGANCRGLSGSIPYHSDLLGRGPLFWPPFSRVTKRSASRRQTPTTGSAPIAYALRFRPERRQRRIEALKRFSGRPVGRPVHHHRKLPTG